MHLIAFYLHRIGDAGTAYFGERLLGAVVPTAITAGGYTGTISASASAITGRPAWTGTTSNSFITTRILIPSAWVGESIVFRWRISHDQSTARTGWYVDDVNYTFNAVSDPFRPFISLTASGNTLSELTPENQVNLTVSTPLPLAQSLLISLPVSGNATLADINGFSASSITLSSGTTSASLPISAVVDGLAEGSETLTLAVSTTATNYTPAVSGATASLNIIDADTPVSPFAAWIVSYVSSGDPLASPTADLDNDGWTNAAEFALGSLPNNPSSRPQLQTTLTSTTLKLHYPTAPPPGVTLSAETSTDLKTWTATGVVTVPNGYEVPRDVATRFLRIAYQVE
ncbi:MAG: hypothetical protein HC845_15525 [Akkermansiaceae bacterium]|nr:hypothetical protein [Akkermansiaceae bacterium]